ncbi:MAG: serine hydrolase domain-containing protein [Anaerolineales bacterium]|jgi:CubicO group peptidase (beta-lactamase class C family)
MPVIPIPAVPVTAILAIPVTEVSTWSGTFATTPPPDWRLSLDISARQALKNTPLAGMTLAVRHNGDPDWVHAYGFADLEGSIQATSSTIYQIGSLSMMFTAAAVMQLVQAGQLDLNVPISQYLQGLPEALQSLTLHQLLTHSSKIVDPAFDTQEMFFGQVNYTSESLFQALVPLLYISSNDVQEVFSYANYILVGLIVEHVSGLSYPDYMQQNVFGPAGLRHTSYCLPPPYRMAIGYYLPEGKFMPLPLNVSAIFAAGGLCSTASDLLDWMDALSSGKVVSPDSYREMITPALLPDGSDSNTGYGFWVWSTPYGQQLAYVDAEASYVSYLIAYPEKGLTVVLLSNTGKPDNDLFKIAESNIPKMMP